MDERTESSRGKRKKILSYLAVLVMILASKTVYFGILYSQVTNIVALLILMVLLCKNTHRFVLSRSKIYIWMGFVSILMIVSFFYLMDIFVNFNGYFGAIIEIALIFLIGLIVSEAMKKQDFIICYCHIMFAICCISLFFFYVEVNDRSLALQISNIFESGSSRYIATPYFTFGWQTATGYNSIFGRNAGMWWEPGAFQGFIVIGLLGLLNYSYLFKRKAVLLIIFVFTLLTTQSTSGYIVLLISFAAYGREYMECLFGSGKLENKSKQTKILMAVGSTVLTILIAIIILRSGNIQEKFSVNNGSYNDRNEDIMGSLKLIAYNPIAGIGLGATGASIRNSVVGTTTATTILTLAVSFGLPFTVFYCYRFVKGVISIFDLGSIMKKIITIVMFAILLMSETLYLLPVYAAFLYKWRGES